MQIVIDIPEEMYKAILLGASGFSDYLHIVTKLGTPLPKGHGRLGDLNELFEKVGNIKPTSKVHYESIGEFMGLITNTPTIIPADERGEK